MTGIIIFGGILLISIAAALFVKVRFDIQFVRKGSDDHLKAEISILRGLIRFKAEVPVADIDISRFSQLMKVETNAEGISPPVGDKGFNFKVPLAEILVHLPRHIKMGIQFLRRYRKAINSLLKSVRFRHFSWKTEIGLGDPANTGIATGFLWAVKGVIYGILSRSVGTVENRPQIAVIPCYYNTCLRLEFHCIFDLRIGNIIIAGLNFVKCRLSS